VKEQRIISRVGNVCEATKESSQELGRFVKQPRIITRVGSLVVQRESSQELEAL
jgi:hypothetical protein